MEIIDELYEVILERKRIKKKGSYVFSLISGGAEAITAKITEESKEVEEAGLSGTREELIHEAADLLFHLLVLLGYRDIRPDEICEELKRRRM